MNIHPATAAVLQFFTFGHLPPKLQEISRPFAELAVQVAKRGGGAECTAALRHLLEAKDAAVRAALDDGNASTRVDVLMSALDPGYVVHAAPGVAS